MSSAAASAGQVYTRLGNPTTESLERRLALLEGGVAAIATASGMAAITTAVLTILRAGDEILSSSSVFGGTFSLFRDTLSNYGIGARFVDPTDLAALRGGGQRAHPADLRRNDRQSENGRPGHRRHRRRSPARPASRCWSTPP